MSANQPTSFRFPFSLGGKVHPEAEQAIRYAFNGLKDVNDAIRALSNKVQGVAVVSTPVATSSSSAGGSTTIAIGKVNDQTGVTAYSLRQTDYGALVIFDDASPVAVTLDNSLVTLPFFSVIENLGAGAATLTPTVGTVNTVAFVTIPEQQSGIVYFDGINWWVTPLPPPGNATPVIDRDSGGSGISLNYSREDHWHPADSSTGTGFVVRDSGATLVSATFTGTTTILGLPVYANNAAAVSGGLVLGNLYRTGADPDFIATVH